MKGDVYWWHRLSKMFKERDVEKFKATLSSNQFIDWCAYEVVDEEHRGKWDRYLAAIRLDLHTLIYTIRKFFGGTWPEPDADKMFMDMEAMEAAASGQQVTPPKWNNGQPIKDEGAKGVETTDPSTLTDKWKHTTAAAKSRWGMLLKGADVKVEPGSMDKGGEHVNRVKPPGA